MINALSLSFLRPWLRFTASNLRIAPVILASALIGACTTASNDGYPSLAKRPVEGTLSTRPPEAQPAPPPLPADASLTERIERYRSDAATGENRFRAALGTAQARARNAAGTGVSSEAWLEAQMAISAADAARGPSVTALASLDTLQATRINANDNVGTIELNEALATIGAMVDAQNRALHALNGSLRQP